MISFLCLSSSSHFSHITSSVSSLQFLLCIILYILLQLFVGHIQCNLPVAISVFLASISLPLSRHLLSLPFFHLPFVYMTSPYDHHPFRLRTFLHPNLHSHFIIFSLFSCLSSQDCSYQFVSRKSGPSPVVSLLMPLTLVHPCMPA